MGRHMRQRIIALCGDAGSDLPSAAVAKKSKLASGGRSAKAVFPIMKVK